MPQPSGQGGTGGGGHSGRVGGGSGGNGGGGHSTTGGGGNGGQGFSHSKHIWQDVWSLDTTVVAVVNETLK